MQIDNFMLEEEFKKRNLKDYNNLVVNRIVHWDIKVHLNKLHSIEKRPNIFDKNYDDDLDELTLNEALKIIKKRDKVDTLYKRDI